MATWLGLRLPVRITAKVVLAIFCLVLLLWLLTPIVMVLLLGDFAERGQAGDLFGSINALFSGLAFAGVIIAILLQREELSLQREELRFTREELSRSATAQEQLLKATNHAAERAETTVSNVEGAWIFGAPYLDAADVARNKLRMYVSNHGNTPGRIVRYHMEFFATAPMHDDPIYNNVDNTKTVEIMGPREKNWPLQHEFAWNGTDMFTVGFVTYEDAFGKRKTSRFCYDISTGKTKIAGSRAYNWFGRE